MRDHSVIEKHVVDPVTGAELHYECFGGGREGGVIYRFLFRTEPDAPLSPFRVWVSDYTSFEKDAYRKRQGLPELNDVIESSRYLKQFIDEHGTYDSVNELELWEETKNAGARARETPGGWDINWDSLPEPVARSLVDALMRVIFLARSRRPDGRGFYTDHLKIRPRLMPVKYVAEARADVFMERDYG